MIVPEVSRLVQASPACRFRTARVRRRGRRDRLTRRLRRRSPAQSSTGAELVGSRPLRRGGRRLFAGVGGDGCCGAGRPRSTAGDRRALPPARASCGCGWIATVVVSRAIVTGCRRRSRRRRRHRRAARADRDDDASGESASDGASPAWIRSSSGDSRAGRRLVGGAVALAGHAWGVGFLARSCSPARSCLGVGGLLAT